jgi:hypothetical protein
MSASRRPAQAALPGGMPAERFEFLLEDPEGSQIVVLFGKPRVQVVHMSSFEEEEEATGLYS